MSIIAENSNHISAINQINASNLLSLLDLSGQQIKVLSLDCFDTILWRKTMSPQDVFFALANKPTFKSLHFSAHLRKSCEGKARNIAEFKNNKYDVSLAEIYRAGFPTAPEETIQALIEDEITTEIEHCYAFPPVIELIRAAKMRGLKIIIVSDTYFSHHQLHRLLASALPADTMLAIDHIFCSSDHGRMKAGGLFNDVLQNINLPADNFLHLGDNNIADFQAPRHHGIHSIHFLQFEQAVQDQLRLHTAAGKILTGTYGTPEPTYHPFRGIFSSYLPNTVEPGTLLGYTSLGPILFAFSKFIEHEIALLQQQGKKLKIAFVLRDGHLLDLTYEAYMGQKVGKRVRISRFTSYAASFRSIDDIVNYLIEIGKTDRFKDLGRQFLLPEQIIEQIDALANQSEKPYEAFIRIIQSAEVINLICQQSANYRQRLLNHLKSELDIQAGDTLMLVDLGYAGTAQRRLAPIFAEIGVELIGRYLLVLQSPGWEKNRAGLLDAHSTDENALRTIIYYILVLEQLCTSNENTVVDYQADGTPILADKGLDHTQYAKVETIQQGCVRFIRDANVFFKKTNLDIPLNILRKVAQAELGRLIFFPTQHELQYLQSFHGETNLGTQDILTLFDPEKGITGLRRRGVFYLEAPSKKTRTNYPYELRVASVDILISSLIQHRFDVELNIRDMLPRQATIPILYSDGNQNYQTTIDAHATFDGYYAIVLPGKLNLSLIIGKLYSWLQIECAELIDTRAFAKQTESSGKVDAMPFLQFQDMSCKGKQLYECVSEQSSIIMTPPPIADTINYVLRIVFRPVECR